MGVVRGRTLIAQLCGRRPLQLLSRFSVRRTHFGVRVSQCLDDDDDDDDDESPYVWLFIFSITLVVFVSS